MDAHFREYLAAVSGMQETYGEPDDTSPTEFHGAASSRSATATVASARSIQGQRQIREVSRAISTEL